MKIIIMIFAFLITNQSLQAQNFPTIKAKSAKQYIGKEVIVTGRLIEFGNSSYAQFAWFYLGTNTGHKQLRIVIQGKQYSNGQKTPIANYKEKEVAIKGIVKENKEIYLEATDTLKLSSR